MELTPIHQYGCLSDLEFLRIHRYVKWYFKRLWGILWNRLQLINMGVISGTCWTWTSRRSWSRWRRRCGWRGAIPDSPSESRNPRQPITSFSDRCQLNQHLTSDFFVWKFFALIFSTYSFSLQFFCARILGQNLLVKCW